MRNPWVAFVNPLVAHFCKAEILDALVVTIKCFDSSSKPYIPQNEPKPISDHSLSYFFDLWAKSPILFPEVDKSLNSHMWPISLDFFGITLPLQILVEFHYIFHGCWVEITLYFFYTNGHSVFI